MVLDLQPVTNAPLPKQGQIPPGDWDMALSWSVSSRWMSLKIPALKDLGEPWQWAFKECGGRAVATGCDPVGRILLRASAQIDGEMVRFWRPDDAITHPIVQGRLLDSSSKPHNRMCFFRERGLWRILDEDPASPNFRKLSLGKEYVGDWRINWNERGSHVFHNGRVIQAADGVFHLYDSLLTKF